MVIFLLALLSACSKPSCLGDQTYKTAQEFPQLTPPPGMAVPKPDPNLAIPEVADGPVAYVKDPNAKNDYGIRCLDVPPRVPPIKPGL